MGIGEVAGSAVQPLHHLCGDQGVEVERGADGNIITDDLPYLRDDVALAVVDAFALHGAV